MPDPDPKISKDPDPKDKTPAAEELQKTLKDKQSLIDQQNQVLQDPAVQEVLTLIAQGKKAVVSENQPKPKPEPKSMKQILGKPKDPDKVDLNSLSNEELIPILSDVVEEYVNQEKETAKEAANGDIQQLNEKLNKTQEMLMTVLAKKQVDDMAVKYDDFDKYRPAMQELSKVNPNFSVEQLYKIAKSDHVLSNPPANQVVSEKPEDSTQFPTWEPVQLRQIDGEKKTTNQSGPSATVIRSGSRSFANMVSVAAEKASRVNG